MRGSGPDKWLRRCQLRDWLMTLCSQRRHGTVCGRGVVYSVSFFFFLKVFHFISASLHFILLDLVSPVADGASSSLQTKLLQSLPCPDYKPETMGCCRVEH